MPDLTPVERARALRDPILKARDEIEANRCLTPELREALLDAGLFRLLVPRDVGGEEPEPLAAYLTYEELARADASVAWVCWNSGLPAVLSRELDAPVRREIFGDRRGVYANSTRPSGIAIREGDDFRLRGRWSLVSGCELATWIPVMARIEREDERPEPRMLFVPRGDVEILDTWDSAGLRASGSHDIVIENVRVPAERSCTPLAVTQIEGALYRFPFTAILGAGCASIALGVARSAFESVLEIIAGSPDSELGPPVQERPTLHAVLARSEAELDAARLLLHNAVDEVWRACQQGEPSLEARALLWRAVVHTSRTCKAVVGALFEAGGTSALYTRDRLERCHRDLWTLSQHIILNPFWAVEAGRVRLGLKPTLPSF